MTVQARALLVLPSGHRAYDEDFAVALPVPAAIDVVDGGVFTLWGTPYVGCCDDVIRALYVLGGAYLPTGAGRLEVAHPDEVHDQ